jgi:transcriptional antiterminator RfaH
MSKPRQEERAYENLVRQGYPCFLPKISVETIRSGKIHLKQEPLFPRYVFVQLSSTEHNWGPIRSTLGVAKLVRFGIDFAKVPPSVIESIQTFAESHQEDAFMEGERLLVKSGPFKGMEAEFRRLDGDSRALVLIELLYKVQRIKIPVEDLTKL